MSVIVVATFSFTTFKHFYVLRHICMLVCFILYYKRNQFVFSLELIFFFVTIKVLPRFINHFQTIVKGVSFNLSSRTWVRDKNLFSVLSQGESYGFEVWSKGKSYRNLQKVRESFSKKNFPTLNQIKYFSIPRIK